MTVVSTACPTSLESDQTKGGGRLGVQRTPSFGAREQKIRSDEDTALIQIEVPTWYLFEVRVKTSHK